MKKFVSILGLSAALLVGTAYAYNPVQIDDTGFNYYSAEDGYTSLQYDEGQLTLVVSDEMTDPVLKVTGDDALPLDSADSDEYNEQLLQAFIPVSDEFTGVSVEHNDVNINAVVDSYTDLFQAEGFSGSVEQNFSHGQVVVYQTDELSARVIFTQQGEDVMVFLTTL